MMGPMRPGIDRNAITLSKSCLGMPRTSNILPTGTIMAPPMPCTTRQTTSSPSVPERAQVSELRVKTMTDDMNMRLAPKRSAAQPLIGTNTAAASK